jgi:cytochrome d ubiquinol oxidase subunit II
MLVLIMTIASLIATLYIRPQILNNFRVRPWGWIIPAVVLGSLAAMKYYHIKTRDRAAFLSSTVYIGAMLGGAAFAMYPYLLPATTNESYSLTIYNAKTGPYSLKVGLAWWLIGMSLAVAYFTFLYWSFRGKVTLSEKSGY